jgi:hypothetical protein
VISAGIKVTRKCGRPASDPPKERGLRALVVLVEASRDIASDAYALSRLARPHELQEFAVKHENELADVDDILGSPAGNSSKTLTLARPNRPPLPPWMQALKRAALFR